MINQIKIFDELGRVVLDYKNVNTSNNFTVDINAIASGKYYVQAISGKQTSVEKLIIK